jgi:hypothetical protein
MKKFSFALFLCLFCFQFQTFAQAKKFNLKFSVSVHSGAYLDITGEFKHGYNFGGGIGLLTSEHIEFTGEFNNYRARLKRANSVLSFNDYSLGLRYLWGKRFHKARPVFETGIGLYPNFNDYTLGDGLIPGINIGAGASINLSKSIDIILKTRLHIIPRSFGESSGLKFYLYNGITAGMKYTF